MEPHSITRVVIAGGGTAGWLAAALLTRQLGPLVDVTLVESEEIGTVGVGEATIPTIRAFHALLGLDENDFVQATGATFKLGIAFEGWSRPEARYIHSFGEVGKSTWMGDFQHFWLAARAGGTAAPIDAYCYEAQAAEAGRFATDPEAQLNYAYHFDAARYARYLRARCEASGLHHVEGQIATVERDAKTGDISALVMKSGTRIAGDLFLDCTGFRALLIGEALGVGHEDWSHWLPTNRALALQTASIAPALPYTRAIAHRAGWQWRIPLQHRVGNGIIYSAEHMSDDAAMALLLGSVDGETLIGPRQIRFTTGRRLRVWEKNCVALSLAAGFVEPLESTSIHLVMIALTRLVQNFPFGGSTPAMTARFNDMTRREMEGVRDFIILHYHLNARDEPFWRYCREMAIPDTLAARIALFREAAQAYQSADDLFRVSSWLQVMLGQGIMPEHYHQMARLMPAPQLAGALDDLAAAIAGKVDHLPLHQEFLEQVLKD